MNSSPKSGLGAFLVSLSLFALEGGTKGFETSSFLEIVEALLLVEWREEFKFNDEGGDDGDNVGDGEESALR